MVVCPLCGADMCSLLWGPVYWGTSRLCPGNDSYYQHAQKTSDYYVEGSRQV